eukprot:GHRQ01010455.1.p1 GENE.GHRQ01010455.1~~GHRQ01010455.1.p1  ORF type:complete len:283 (+),score=49.06 GHRQ01010455.1:69-917(+)
MSLCSLIEHSNIFRQVWEMRQIRNWHIRCASCPVLLLLYFLIPAPASSHQAPGVEDNMKLHRHTPTCSLLFQTPACSKPAVSRPRRGSAVPASHSRCAYDTCSVNGPSHAAPGSAVLPVNAQAKRDVRAQATQASSTSTDTKWWKQQSELWVEVHTDEEFYEEINTGDRLVFVDYFATWCNGCQRSYPELCRLAMDPDLYKHIKFVKVCIEELKKVSRDMGVTALPHAQLFQPGVGKLASLDIPPSKIKHLRHNLQVGVACQQLRQPRLCRTAAVLAAYLLG